MSKNLCECASLDWSGVDQTLEHHPDCTSLEYQAQAAKAGVPFFEHELRCPASITNHATNPPSEVQCSRQQGHTDPHLFVAEASGMRFEEVGYWGKSIVDMLDKPDDAQRTARILIQEGHRMGPR